MKSNRTGFIVVLLLLICPVCIGSQSDRPETKLAVDPPGDREEVFEQTAKAAEQGDAAAQYRVTFKMYDKKK